MKMEIEIQETVGRRDGEGRRTEKEIRSTK